ncbi:MAG: hypothetical protein JKY50_07640, partial [Oleispira sp.]|nr:hypothetical protein [Oleispira sp.]
MNVFIKAVIIATSLSGLLASCSDEISVASDPAPTVAPAPTIAPAPVVAPAPGVTPAPAVVPATAVVGAISISNTHVIVSFSVAMGDAAENPANYSIVSENVTNEAGALSITGASFSGIDHKAVILTTLSQNEIAYRVSVVNVQDVTGQNFQVTATNTGYYTANNASFAGTPSGGVGIIDTDGDGMPDNEEQRGWLVTITNGNGQVTVREVTSD